MTDKGGDSGEELNPHIPQFIGVAPCGIFLMEPHHLHISEQGMQRYQKPCQTKSGIREAEGQQSFKYRKGACTNCGAMGHTTKDCTERPRKVGAKFSGVDIRKDDIIADEKELALDYDSKRDTYNGFVPEFYNGTLKFYEKTEEERKRRRLMNLKGNEDEEGEDGVRVDESKADNSAVASVDPRTRTAIRNLRIREDTPKYLYNLDVNSAYYDPKSRAMPESPFANMEGVIMKSKLTEGKDNGKESGKDQDISALPAFKGDAWVKWTGDTQEFARMQLFSIEAEQRGSNKGIRKSRDGEDGEEQDEKDEGSGTSAASTLHSISNPLQTELAFRQYEQKKQKLEDQTKQELIQKYGGQEHTSLPPGELLLGQTEIYIEYSKDGREKMIGTGAAVTAQINAKKKLAPQIQQTSQQQLQTQQSSTSLLQSTVIPSSKYEEDQYPGNHTSVFGSYWEKGKWGYACCHQFYRNSYCTGLAGIQSHSISIAVSEMKEMKEQDKDQLNDNNNNNNNNMNKDTNKQLVQKNVQKPIDEDLELIQKRKRKRDDIIGDEDNNNDESSSSSNDEDNQMLPPKQR